MIYYKPILYYNIFGFKMDPEFIPGVIAFIIFILYSYFHLKKHFEDLEDLKEFSKFIALMIFFSMFIGRAWYYFRDSICLENLIKFFNFTNGGLVSVGVMLGGGIGLLAYIFISKRKNKLEFFARIMDIIIPGGALSFFVYRLFACFLFGDVIGKPTTNFLGLFYITTGEIKHPVALYLSLSALVIFFILRLFFGHEKTPKTKLGKRFDGEVGLWFLLLYCFNRFFIEFLALGHNYQIYPRYLGLFKVQWICLGGVLSSLLIIGYIYLDLIKKKIKSYKE